MIPAFEMVMKAKGNVYHLECFACQQCNHRSHISTVKILTITRNAFCGTWYLPHSQVHNERTVPIIMAGCIALARNGRISTSGEKSDVTIVFLDPDFLCNAKISAIRVHLRQILDYLIFAWVFGTFWPKMGSLWCK